MNYFLFLKRFIQEQYMDGKQLSQEHLLEKIWHYHMLHSPVDTIGIQQQLTSISSLINNLSRKKQLKLSSVVAEMCLEHERIAFIRGVVTGVQLVHEIDAVEKEMNKGKQTE